MGNSRVSEIRFRIWQTSTVPHTSLAPAFYSNPDEQIILNSPVWMEKTLTSGRFIFCAFSPTARCDHEGQLLLPSRYQVQILACRGRAIGDQLRNFGSNGIRYKSYSTKGKLCPTTCNFHFPDDCHNKIAK